LSFRRAESARGGLRIAGSLISDDAFQAVSKGFPPVGCYQRGSRSQKWDHQDGVTISRLRVDQPQQPALTTSVTTWRTSLPFPTPSSCTLILSRGPGRTVARAARLQRQPAPARGFCLRRAPATPSPGPSGRVGFCRPVTLPNARRVRSTIFSSSSRNGGSPLCRARACLI
jgi:hypothetical protein